MFHSFLINYYVFRTAVTCTEPLLDQLPTTLYGLSRRVRRSIQRRLQPVMYVWIEYARLSCKRKRQGARSSVNCSQFSVFMLSAFKSLFSTSLWRSLGRPTGRGAESSCPYKVSFGSRPSSILHTWPLQRSRNILRREIISGAPVLSIIVVFGIRSCQDTPRMDRRQQKWNASSTVYFWAQNKQFVLNRF